MAHPSISHGTVFLFEVNVKANVEQKKVTPKLNSESLDQSTSVFNPEQPSQDNLCTQSLAVMSAAWIEELYQGAAQCSDRQLQVLIEQIPPEHSTLAQTLKDLVEDFRFDIILELANPYLYKSSK